MKQKRLIAITMSLILMLALVITSAAAISTAEDGEVTDAMTEINSSLNGYAVGDKISLASDGYIGIPVEISVFFDSARFTAKPGYESTHTILYAVNTRMERTGTDSDVSIISSMLERGYAVVVVDYKNSERAVSPDLDWSAQVIRNKMKVGEYFSDKSVFPSGTYYNTYVVPAGHNVSLSNVYWEMDKHGTDGTLEKIVEIWNNDFRAIKGETVIKWTDGDGNRKATQTGRDGTAPVWLRADGSADTEGEYIKVKHTKAEVITDCVKADGTPIDLNLYMHLIYPTNPKADVPVMALASSAEHLANGAANADRPHLNGFVFNGYAGVIYDFGYTPMARDDHYGYFDGSSTGSVTGDNLTYSIHFFNDKLIDTAAMRYIRYLSLSDEEFSFDCDAIGVYGNSKGGWMTALGEEHPELLGQRRIFPDHHGETRYENGITETAGVIDGGEEQPWLSYNGEKIASNAQLIYASCGGQEDLISGTHCPVFVTCNVQDGSYWGTMPEFVNVCRTSDVPLMWFEVNIGHTLTSGKDANYGVDTYQALFDFAGYCLRDDAVKVVYIHSEADEYSGMPTSAPITVKFTGPVPESQIELVTLTSSDGETVSGRWTSLYGNTEWTFHPSTLSGSTEYTLTVPGDIAAENGYAMGDDYTYTYTTGYEISDSTELMSVSTDRGTYYYFTMPDTSAVTEFEVNRQILRLAVSGEAANILRVSALSSFNPDSPNSSVVGDTVARITVSGEGYYDVDLTDTLKDARAGDTVALLVAEEKAAGNVTVASTTLDGTAGSKASLSIGGQAKDEFAEIDGQTALKISDILVTTAYTNDTFYNNPTTIMSRFNIIGKTSLEDTDLGRKFIISVDVYDTVSRRGQLLLNSCTSESTETVDYNHCIYNITTEAGKWVTYTLEYTVYEPTLDNYAAKSLTVRLYNQGEENANSPIYFKNITATEIITDINITDASLLLTTTEQRENPLLTDYGAISSLYADEELYPLVAFDSKGDCIVGAAFFATDTGGGALGAFAKNSETSGAIVLRRDYTYNEAAYNNLSFVFGTVVIDLGGHTLTLAESHSRSLFYADAKRSATTNIIIKNGNIVLGKNPLIQLGGMASGNYNYANDVKDFNFTLENVNISLSDTATATSLITNKADASAAPVNGSLRLVDCTVDLVGRDGFTLFNLGDTGGYVRAVGEISGGAIYADSIDSFRIASINNGTSSFSLTESDNGYPRICSLSGEGVSEAFNVNGNPMRFEPDGEKDGYTVYTLNVCALATPYGDIPSDFESTDEYPFAIFHRPAGASAYTFITAIADGFHDDSVTKYWSLKGDVVILMRRDFAATERFTNLKQTQASSITYDLGGFTLTASTSSQTYYMNATTPTYEVTEFNLIFKNGGISTGDKAFMLIGGNKENSSLNSVYSLTFEGIDFTADTSTNAHPFVEFTSAVTPFSCNISYNECDFDLTHSVRPSQFRIFTSGEAGSKISSSVTVRGGSITTNSSNISGIILTYAQGLGSVIFESGEDGYVTLVTTTGSAAPKWVCNTAGGSLGFSLVSSAGGYDTYTLASLNTEYGSIPASYASIADYPFVLFHKAEGATEYTFLDATGNAFYDGYVTKYRNLSGEIVILMRRDVDHSTLGHFSNIRQCKGDLVYDFGGFTFIGNASTNYGTYFINATAPLQSGKTVFNVTFKNGSIVTSSKTFLMIGANGSGGDGCIYNVRFEGLKLIRKAGATAVDPFVQFGGGTSSAFHANISYADCEFILGGSFPSSFRLFAAGTATDKVTATVTVIGCSVSADSFPTLTFTSGSSSSVIFARDTVTGKYLTVTLPASAAAPTGTYYTKTKRALTFTPTESDTLAIYQLTSVDKPDYTPKTSITLYSDFALNLYLPVSDYLASFTLDGVLYTDLSQLEICEKDGEKYYRIVTRIPPSEAGRSIPLSITLSIDGESEIIDGSIGIIEYAELLLGKTDTTAVQATLVKDILSYIKAAYIYSRDVDGVSIDESVIERIDGILGDGYDETSLPDTDAERRKSTDGMHSARLLLTDTPAFMFYPEVDGDGNTVYDTSLYTFYINGAAREATLITGEDGRKYFLIYTYAFELSMTVSYTVEGTDTRGEYNIAAYYDFALTSGDALAGLTERLWRYSESALAYKKECEAALNQ